MIERRVGVLLLGILKYSPQERVRVNVLRKIGRALWREF